MLSSTLLRYPTPVLINWGVKEDKNDIFFGHLAKVGTILKYLNKLYSEGKQDDLVLIVDGFDIHFQLPPEVLIKRYFEANKAAQKRINDQVGTINAHGYNLKQSVLFGQDKVCWPLGPNRPACWVVPEASYPKYAFGPETDDGDAMHQRARWLNSGTVMGPIGDVRDVFQATLDNIAKNHTTDSDQYYFANVHAEQEYARRLLQPEPFTAQEKSNKNLIRPVFEKDQKTELHMGIDHEGLLWQVLGFFRPSVTWMTFSGSPTLPQTPKDGRQTYFVRDEYLDRSLPSDLATARPPFSAVLEQLRTRGKTSTSTDLPTDLTWADLKLGINAISNNIFPMLHYTGPKWFRDDWWPRMWYYPYAEALLKAAVSLERQPIHEKAIGGKVWWPAVVDVSEGVRGGDKGGAVSDGGLWLNWGELCAVHEELIYTGKKPPPPPVGV